jgi:DNA-binding transcriptional ArsR family regulator
MCEFEDGSGVDYIHADCEVIERIKNEMPAEEIMYDLAELYKIFGDSTRIKILCVLLESEMCVSDISLLIGISQSAISHQLRSLKQSKLIKYRREGKTMLYSLADEHVRTIINNGIEHISE